MLDTVLKNGRVVDGTGNPWFHGDVGIKNGVIAEIGKIDSESQETIDARGQYISPGFIDGHCHSDLMVLDHPHSNIKIQQGVTTEVVGNCGLSPAPFTKQFGEQLKEYVSPVLGTTDREWTWSSVEDYVNQLMTTHPSENVATYVAHGSLRIAVMGFEQRLATKKELQQMKHLLEEGMKAGAIGLSIGLLYAPGSYANKEEIAELCSVLPKYNGLFATHIRGEGNNLIPSIKEVIWIAEKSGVPLHVSHLKAAGKRNWGMVTEAVELIEKSRQRGMNVTCDMYPYSAGSTTLTTLLPPWTLEGGIEKTIARLKDKSTKEKIKQELNEEQTDWDNLVVSTGWQSVYVSSISAPKYQEFEGKHIEEISYHFGMDAVDTALDMLIQANGNVSIVFFHMSENDVTDVLRYKNSLIASDSLTCSTGTPHPRLFGTFPKVLSQLVLRDRILTMEDAVRKMTSFPAQKFNLGRRGLITLDYNADIVVFDPENIEDNASYQNPTQYPDGVSYVFVNGKKTSAFKTHTKERNGGYIVSGPSIK